MTSKPTEGGGRFARIGQIRQTLVATAKVDPKFLPIVLGSGLGVFAVFVLIGILIHQPILLAIFGLLAGALVAMSLAGRRATTVAFSRLDGQPGAAFAVLSSMRGDWRVTQAVEFTRSYDLVHRVVGRPGVVLVAEGSGARPKELIGTHARKVRRVIGDKPIYDVVVGDGEGQVPLRKLQAHVTKLPRNLKPKEVNDLEARLKAIGGPNMPIPKGPMPKGGKVPRGKIR
jgi:hypothetical protein